jgi:hypothetical protein
MSIDLCDWQYRRHSYCIIMNDEELKPYQAFYSAGTDVDPESEIAALSTKLGVEVTPLADKKLSNLYIEDEDTVLIMSQKVSAKTQYMADYLYFWINHGEEGTSMQFSLLYNKDDSTMRRFTYDIVPSKDFFEQIADAGEWQHHRRVVTLSKATFLLNSVN